MPGLSLSRLSMDVTRGPLPVERMCVLNPGGKMWKSQFGLQVKRVLLLPSPVVPSAPFCFLHLHTWEQNITVATPPSATNMKFQSCNLEADWNTDRREKKTEVWVVLFHSAVKQLRDEGLKNVTSAALWGNNADSLWLTQHHQHNVKSFHVNFTKRRLFILYLNSLSWFVYCKF